MAPNTPPQTPGPNAGTTPGAPAATTSGPTALDASANAMVVARPTAGLLPVNTSAPTGVVRIPCAGSATVLSGNITARTYNFKSHPMVKAALAIFSVVQLAEVRIFLHQRNIFAAPEYTNATTPGARPFHIRVGLGPSGTVVATGDATAGYTSVADRIPNLRNFITSPNHGTSATFEYSIRPGPGVFAMPAGMQTDLRAIEVRHKHAEVIVANASYATAAAYEIVHIQVDFVIECSGSNFGEVPV